MHKDSTRVLRSLSAPSRYHSIVLTAAALVTLGASTAQADCPAAPITDANDMVISFLVANGTQIAPGAKLPSTVKEGMLLYDDTANALKICNGTAWQSISVGGSGSTAAGTVAGAVQFRGATAVLAADDANFVWDDTNNRLGVGTASPAASALLDLTSTSRGLLPPRMTTVQRDAITTPATGLEIYNTTTNQPNFYNGAAWTATGSGAGGTSSGATGYLQLSGGSGAFASSSAASGQQLFWDTTNHRLGIGTDNPTKTLDVRGEFVIHPNTQNTGSRLISRSINTDGRWALDVRATSVSADLQALITRPGQLGLGSGEFSNGDLNSAIGVINDTVFIPKLRIGGANTGPTNVSGLTIGASSSTEWQTAGTYPNGTNHYAIKTVLTSASSAERAPLVLSGHNLSFWTGATETERLRIDANGNVGIGTTAPAATALLDVSSTSKGFLPPRMTTVQRDAIATPATGLMIFNITNAAFEFYNGTAWSTVGAAMPNGTIAAFAAASCPSGWSEYTAARGRFLRGIDPSGTNDSVRAAGNVQSDALGSHQHQIASQSGPSGVNGGGNSDGGSYMAGIASNNWGAQQSSFVGGTETRPKNVAVTFCQYNGTGSTGGGGGSVTADSLDFTDFKDAMALDASTDITASGTNVLSVTNAGTGNSFVVNDAASDTSPFVIDASGNVGIGTSTPTNALQIEGTGQANDDIVIRSATSVAGEGGALFLNRSRGTNAAPAAVNSGDLLGDIFFAGHTGSAFANAAVIKGLAEQAFTTTPSTQDAALTFYTALDSVIAERMRISSAGNVGIGTSTPQTPLAIQGPTPRISIFDNDVAISAVNPAWIVRSKDEGLANGSFMIQSTADYTAFTDRFIIKSDGIVGIGATVLQAENKLTLGPQDSSQEGGQLALLPAGANTSSWAIDVYQNNLRIINGNASGVTNTLTAFFTPAGNMTLTGTLTQNSDRRLKADIRPITDAIGKLSRINGITYHWLDKSRERREQLGVLAQDVEQVFPQAVTSDENGFMSVNYSGLIAPLIEATKELKAQNDELRANLYAANDNDAAQDRAIDELRSELRKLRSDR